MQQQTNQGFIPNFCDVAIVFMLVLLVELLALLLALVPSSRLDFWDRLALISLFAQWMALINAALLCGLKDWLNRQSVVICSLSSFSIMWLVTFTFSAIVMYFGEPFGLIGRAYGIEAYYFLLRNLAISGIIYSVVLRYFYVQHQWRSNLEAQSIAQIQALKARIRPHFLFNSMNTIASLVHIDANKAEKAVEDLSDLFRASLQEGTGHTLRQEVALTGSYLDIEHLRLDDRLQVEWQLDEKAMEVEVPTLCLQPLAENAIYHGIEPMDTGGKIKISAQLENNRLCLSVSNPVSEQSSMSRHEGNHMAQANIKTRLMLMYADEAQFSIKAESNTYTVFIGIPL
ncbi:hypothetical protein MNBD_GAMMA10-1134 [hydrothermal vent metagenome]|uniref:Signal transduction histidine kinase internal region domain-containing protein n=1 Tax=hydrothermal vent metagenome TaxID=652676 RepID=A0A3B0XI25_9ZZZZ